MNMGKNTLNEILRERDNSWNRRISEEESRAKKSKERIDALKDVRLDAFDFEQYMKSECRRRNALLYSKVKANEM